MEFEGHCYKLYELAESWDDARSICQKNGGDLAAVNNEQEFYFIWRQFKLHMYNNHNGVPYWHVGFYTDATGAGHLVTGESEYYVSWGSYVLPLAPNKCAGVDPQPTWGYGLTWFTYECSLKAFFICEVPVI